MYLLCKIQTRSFKSRYLHEILRGIVCQVGEDEKGVKRKLIIIKRHYNDKMPKGMDRARIPERGRAAHIEVYKIICQ
jgi:hypothetical protein